jgi:hypothetical protein
MRLSKFLVCVSVFTLVSLVYVYQQSEIFRLAYAAQKRLSVYQDLLDKNTVLRYNIEKSASLIRIGNKLSQGSDFQMPDSYQLVKLGVMAEGAESSAPVAKRENIASRFFGVRREVEARTINP